MQFYPVDSLELDLIASQQQLDAAQPLSSDAELFREKGTQLKAIWHFSNRMYVEISSKREVTDRNQANYGIPVDTHATSSLRTLQFAYELMPQTHFYVGYRTHSEVALGATGVDINQRQFFIKAAIEFEP